MNSGKESEKIKSPHGIEHGRVQPIKPLIRSKSFISLPGWGAFGIEEGRINPSGE